MVARSNKPFGRLMWPGLALVLTGVYGVAGYMLVERWSFVDALYMTLLALTSVGFEEARPLSLAGEWFTISLLGLGVGIFVVTLSLMGVAISEGAFGQRTFRRRMQRRIGALSDHYIVCAYGRVGRTAARECAEEGVPFVVLEPKDELVELMEDDDILFLIGDSTSDESLRAAGIERARASCARSTRTPTTSTSRLRLARSIPTSSSWDGPRIRPQRIGCTKPAPTGSSPFTHQRANTWRPWRCGRASSTISS